MNRTSLVLIVDDDPQIREMVRFALEKEGYATCEAGDGVEALRAFEERSPDLLVLDILMPELDGTEVCRRIRAESEVPIIFLSSRDEELDRVVGLELGGDDYVTKPFSPRELAARVRAVLRRSAMRSDPQRTVEPRRILHGKLALDLDLHEAFWNDRQITLTVTEFGLLQTLMGFPGKVYTRDELMQGAYTYDNVVTGRTIDSHIRRVRKKLAAAGADPIQTIHGLGYKLGPCDAEADGG